MAFAEVEPFPCAVLAERFPDVPNLGDVTKFKEWPDVCVCPTGESDRSGGEERSAGGGVEQGAELHSELNGQARSSLCEKCGGFNGKIDIVVGGSPCQSFSVAGLRKGLDDPRGNLALTYLAIVEKYKPEWVIWENVPGVLSSGGGRDFGSFLGALENIGYGFAYRVLDAQYVRTPDYPRAVPQRRRRVFVVGSLRGAECAAAVLFDSESVCGNPTPRREARKGFASFTPTSFGKYSEGVGTLKAAGGDLGGGSETLTTGFFDAQAFKVRGGSETETGEQGGTPGRKAGKGYLGSEELAFTVASSQDQHIFYPSVGETSPTVTSKWHKGSGGPAGSETGNMVVAQDVAGTLDASYHKGCGERGGIEREVVAYENHANDSRIKQLDGNVSPSVVARWGTGGNNQALVQTVAVRTANTNANGHGIAEEVTHTLDQTNSNAIAYAVDVYNQAVNGDVSATVTEAVGGTNTSGPKVMQHPTPVASTLLSRDYKDINTDALNPHSAKLVAVSFEPGSIARNAGPAGESDVCPTLRSEMGDNQPAVRIESPVLMDQGGSVMSVLEDGTVGTLRRETHGHEPSIVAPSLTASNNPSRSPQSSEVTQQVETVLHSTMQVRRLTPLECERLQGFPDEWTRIAWKKKGPEDCPDGPRYKAIGNSMAVNVMQWIGIRIAITKELLDI